MEPERPQLALLLMGVSGAGKTTIGRLLAADLGWTFIDADDLHPAANRRKMASGSPLTDDDRWPWLRRVRDAIDDSLRRDRSLVVACSALKQAYRELLGAGIEGLCFVYLCADAEVIAARLERRRGHFMPAELLASQFAALEEPDAATTWVVDVDGSPETIVAEILRHLGTLEED